MAERAASDVGRRMPVGTPEHFQWLQGIVKAVLVLNLVDALLTLVWVQAGLAVEANSLMQELLDQNPVLFVSVKLTLVGLGSWLLWKRRQSPLAVVAIFAAFLTYYWVLLHHLRYASVLFRNTFGA